MEKETFESVLKEKLGNHELPVNPSLWKSVSAQAGLSSGGSGLGFGAWIGIASCLIAITAGLFYFTTSKKDVANGSSKKQEEKTNVNEPEKIDNNVINSNGGKAYANIEPDTTEHIIYCSFPVVDEKPKDVLDTKNLELIYLQDNQVQTSSELSIQGISAIQNTSNTELISKKENAIEQTLEKPQAKAFVMPNAITPNGDGINDVLTLTTEGLTDFNVVVLDAANNLVYSSTDPNFKWNGSLLNGDPAPAGTYQYYYTAKDENGIWCNQFSSLTLLR